MDKKEANLLMDEFNPRKQVRSFWMVPKVIMAHASLSLGAKMLYGVLMGLAGNYGTAYPSRKKLQQFLGNPSEKTLYRWQQELVKAGLIRVLQKGRGLSNNYYFLRSPLFGNAEEGEFEEGARYLYRNKKHGTQTIVSENDARYMFKQEVQEWFDDALAGNTYAFPKPCWPFNRTAYSQYRKQCEQKLYELQGINA